MLDVVLEVAADRVAARVVGRPVGHRELGELGAVAARDQVQRAVGRGRALVVVERPHAADARPALERDRVEAARGERAEGGES